MEKLARKINGIKGCDDDTLWATLVDLPTPVSVRFLLNYLKKINKAQWEIENRFSAYAAIMPAGQ